MVRPGSTRGRLVARYGASQAGSVLRYHLDRAAGSPAIFLRTTAALASPTERELAAGISARPLRAIPVRAQAELRAREIGEGVEIAPAAMVVSEIAPLPLPFELRAEPYVAAGYVAGKQATAFVDAMVRVDRRLAGQDANQVRLGAGAWGGAQDGLAALDVGPSASMRAAVAGRPLTLSIDYRLRIAGSARPRSGVAVSLSAGF